MLNLCPFHCVNSYAIESPVSKHECESMFVCVFLFFTEELRCAGVTCPNLQVPSCPEGSVLTKSYKPPAECCPSVPPQCTCDFSACHKPQCPSGQHPVSLGQASGQPGDCCDVYECQKGNFTDEHATHCSGSNNSNFTVDVQIILFNILLSFCFFVGFFCRRSHFLLLCELIF